MKKERTKNPCSKTRPIEDPYEIWESRDGTWRWSVLKKWQNPEQEEKNPYARWFCSVVSPMCPWGEMGDCYRQDIVQNARRVK